MLFVRLVPSMRGILAGMKPKGTGNLRIGAAAQLYIAIRILIFCCENATKRKLEQNLMFRSIDVEVSASNHS